MTKGIPKKRQRAEQLRKKRAQAAPGLGAGGQNASQGNPDSASGARGRPGSARGLIA